MKLHLPKRLFTAILTAITLTAVTLGSAAWGDTSTTIEGSLTLSGTSDDAVYFYTTGTIPQNSSAKYIVAINGSGNGGTGRININGVANTIPEGAILVAAAGVKADGTTYTGGELYFNRWNGSIIQGNLTIKNEIILGSSTHDHGAMRLNDSAETSKIILQGDITLAANSKIFNAGDFNYIEGAINGEGKELILDNGGKLYLSGGANLGTLQLGTGQNNNVNLYLSATKSDGTTQADATDYTVGSITGTSGAVYVGSGTSLTITSGGVEGALSNDGTLVIAGSDADTNGTLLTKATGTGDVEITADTIVPDGGSSQLTGKLTINGATLYMNEGTGHRYNLSSFTSGEWKGATINYHAIGSTFQNVTVSGDEASYIKIQDMGEWGSSNRPAPLILSGTTTLNKNLEVSSTGWKYSVKIEKLTGNGNLTFNGSSQDDLFATIESFDNYGGDVSFNSTATGEPKELTLGKDASSILNFATNSSVTASTGTTTLIKGQVTGNATISGDRIDIEALLAGSASISGNTINISSDQEIGGVVSLTGTTLSLAGVTVLNGGTLSIEGSTTFTNTITNAGTLSLNGNLSINDITRLEVAEDSTETFSDGSHGYLSATYKVVDNTGTVTLNGATLNGLTLSGGGNGDVNVIIETSSGDYYVNSASEALVYNTGDTVTSEVAADSTTGIILSGGNLNMVTGLNAAATSGITAVKDATINLGGNVTLNQSDLHLSGGTITLTGSGTYVAGKSSAVNVATTSLQDSTKWTGTVLFTGNVSESTGFDNSFGNVNSTIEMKGAHGWLRNALNMHSILKLTREGEGVNDPNGFTVTAASNWQHTFSNKVWGNGDFTVANTGDGNPDYFFTGDLSEWSGAFKVSNPTGKEIIVKMTGGGNLFAEDAGGIVVTEDAAGTVSATLGSTNSAVKTTMRGSVINESDGAALNLTVQGNTDFQKDVTVTSMTVNSGKTATLTGEANSMVIGNATITSKAGTDAALSNVTVDAPTKENTISATSTADGTKGSISNAGVEIAQLAQDASFTIQDMTLTNTTITAATVNTKVNLKNVSGDVALKTGAFGVEMTTVGMGGSALSYTEGAPSITLSSTDAGAAKLMISANPTLDVQGAYGTYSLTFNLNLQLDTSIDEPASNEAWGELVGFEGWLGTMLEDQNATFAGAAGEPVVQSSAPSVSYGYTAGSGGNVGTLVITINGLNVPEPTTATLSLLALAALAARRRRKA